MKFFTFFFLMSYLLWVPIAYATRSPLSLPVDARIKVISYHPNDIIRYTGHYEYLSSIVFEESEEIKTIYMGNSTLWDIQISGNRLFLKPIEEKADTNMTVISDKRIYQFELHATELDKEKGMDDESLVFELRILFSGDTSSGGVVTHLSRGSSIPDLSEPEKYNFNYTVSGTQTITPLKIFDDDEFTYFQFPHNNAEVPAIFIVQSDSRESLVNYRVKGDYIVVETVASQFTLRSGSDTLCVFNENRPLPPAIEG